MKNKKWTKSLHLKMLSIVESKQNALKVTIESINGRIVNLVSLNALSKYVGLKSHTLRQWEKKGIIPQPNIVKAMDSKLFGKCGRRLYLEEQAHVLAEWVSRVKPNHGVRIRESMIQILHKKWDRATEDFINESCRDKDNDKSILENIS